MKYLLILLLVMCTAGISAQDIQTQILQQISLIQSGKNPDRKVLEQSIAKHPENVFRALSAYQTDTLPDVRMWVYDRYREILAEHTKPLTLRHDITFKLIQGIADTESGNRNQCVEYLTLCVKEDFTAESQSLFCEIFNRKTWLSDDLILLAGFIGNPDCRATLEDLTYNASRRKFQWNATLALARMGDNNAINRCLARLQQVGINDDVTYELLPGLIYTRQHRTFEYLVEILNSDDPACSSANPDLDTPILCGYRVMEYLAVVIKRYPLKVLPSGDIDTKDYHKALLSVRDWFAKQKGNYQIIENTF